MKRNLSVDIFRGLTMFLMLLVNDLWTIGDVPAWMRHTATFTDGMGLADIVFPMFLLAMGMSIPLAIENRHANGYTTRAVLRHILSRSFTLVVMGVFLVNSEGTFAPLLHYSKGVYWLLVVLSFFFIWNAYPPKVKRGPVLKKLFPFFRGLGVFILLFLAITFRTEEGGTFTTSWWGILGILGWSYLFCAIAYLLVREKKRPLVNLLLAYAVLVGVNILTVNTKSGSLLWEGCPAALGDFFRALHLGNCSSAIMTLGGVILMIADMRLHSGVEKKQGELLARGLGAGIAFLVLGFLTNGVWIISKNIGTLPWCMIVTGISVILYTLLRFLEKKSLVGWSAPFLPAGKAPLTTYMIPYVFYGLAAIFAIHSPAWLTGYLGVLKCILFAFLCIGVSWCLGKISVKIKI